MRDAHREMEPAGLERPPMDEIRVVIAGGGTGGHLYPGLAVADALRRQEPRVVVSFAGTARGLEARIVPAAGYPLDTIRSVGLKGKSLGALARGLALLPASAADAWTVVSRRRPHVVIGVGGYSSGPVVACAAARRVPTMVLEQNAMPGLTNRLLAWVVDAAALTYDKALPFFGTRGFVSGNPVRSSFLDRAALPGKETQPLDERFSDQHASDQRPSGQHVSQHHASHHHASDYHGSDHHPSDQHASAQRTSAQDASRGEYRLLVFGGSQGAHAINVAVMEALATLREAFPRLWITHQTGQADLQAVRAAHEAAGGPGRVEPFMVDLDVEMMRADLVVCRAGATTLAELAVAGKAAVLVPLPTATDDHQRKNAAALAECRAAAVVDQRELTGARLAQRIIELLRDDAGRRALGAAIRELARPDAAQVVARHALALAQTKGASRW